MSAPAPASLEGVEAAVQRLRRERAGSPGRRFAEMLRFDEDAGGDAELLSIVVPVFGDGGTGALEACLAGLRAQRGVRIEVVLAEQTFGEARHAALAARFGAVHAVDRVDPAEHGEHPNLGRVRNAALAAASGAFVYMADGDVLYPDPNYFATLVAVASRFPDLVLIRPRMAHLVRTEGQAEACRAYADDPAWPPPGVEHPAPLVYRAGPEEGDGWLEINRGGKRHLVAVEALHEYGRRPAAGWEPRFLQACTHDGAVLARRTHFDAVAGYAECFFHWGGDDVDLQWKLGELFCVVALEKMEGVEVVHVDHERGWYDRLLWERNRLLRERRHAAGVLGTLVSDLLEGTSSYVTHLRARTRLHIGAPASAGAAVNGGKA